MQDWNTWRQSNKLQEHFDYNKMFTDIHENISDFDTLAIGTEIIKIARDRLDGDLDKKEIKEEYDKLMQIIKELNKVLDNYV